MLLHLTTAICIFIFYIITRLIDDYMKKQYSITLLNKKLTTNTFIICDYKCKCFHINNLTLFKCNFCKLNNVINFENINSVMQMLRIINIKEKIDLIIHTEGGSSCYSDAISSLFCINNLNIHTYIPEYAQSAGTIIALTGKQIHCNWYSFFSPVDSQLEFYTDNDYDQDLTFSSKHIKYIKTIKDSSNIDKLQALEAESHYKEDKYIMNIILKNNTNKKEIIRKFVDTDFPHGFNITYNDMKKMNLPVDLDISDNIKFSFKLFKFILNL